MTPLREVPYPPYVADDFRQAPQIRVDWGMLGVWVCRLLFLGTMAFTFGLTVWLFL